MQRKTVQLDYTYGMTQNETTYVHPNSLGLFAYSLSLAVRPSPARPQYPKTL